MADAREIVPDVAALASGKSPPASNSAIRSLPLVYVSVDDLLEESNKECLICLEGHRIGSLAYKLACGHLFHTPCITKWLQKHCTCPVCRYELRTDDDNYEKERRKRMLLRKMRYRLDELQAKKVSQLRELASSLVVSIAGCIDKTEVIEKLLASGRIELVEAAPAMVIKEAELKAMTVTELKSLLRQFGLTDSGALEKSELRQRLLNSKRVVMDSMFEIPISEDSVADYVETAEKNNIEADSYGNAVRNETRSWTYDCSSSHGGMEVEEDIREETFDDTRGNREFYVQQESANITSHERTLEQFAGSTTCTCAMSDYVSSSVERLYSKNISTGINPSQQPNEQSYQYDISHIENNHMSSPSSGTRIDVSALISRSAGGKDSRMRSVNNSSSVGSSRLRNICVKDDK